MQVLVNYSNIKVDQVPLHSINLIEQIIWNNNHGIEKILVKGINELFQILLNNKNVMQNFKYFR